MHQKPRIFALIVAAGVGARAGGVAKQYLPLGGKPMLCHSIESLATHPAIAGVQVVIHPAHEGLYAEAVRDLIPNPQSPIPLLPPVLGGAERADSVQKGLAALATHAPDYVLIHDAARPFLSHTVIDRILAALTPEEAVAPALPMADTVRRLEDGVWLEVPREGLWRIQTPQAFPFTRLVGIGDWGLGIGEALSRQSSVVSSEGRTDVPPPASGRGSSSAAPLSLTPIPNPQSPIPPSPTDEAAVWLAAGGSLRYVLGDEDLRKVTTPEDIAWAQAHTAPTCRTAIGMGYDVHALMPAGDKQCIRLGGIDIANAHSLHGHSDADVVLHAVVDALLGSISAGDIGSHFPPSDARWKGANSAIFVEEARAQVAAHGGVISHLDITIIGEQPKIAPHRDAMRQAIANLLHLPASHVSVKATTTEKLGFTGREEGIACHALATVSLPMERV